MCEYCKQKIISCKNIYLGETHLIDWRKTEVRVDITVPANFCPACGRKLGE